LKVDFILPRYTPRLIGSSRSAPPVKRELFLARGARISPGEPRPEPVLPFRAHLGRWGSNPDPLFFGTSPESAT
jgi:hypothetical protein